MTQHGLDDFAETVETVQEEVEGSSDEWPRKTIEEVCQTNPGSINDAGFDYDEIQYLDISSTANGYIKELQTFSMEEAPSRAKRTVSTGDSVVSTVRPNRKHYVYIDDPPENLVVSTGFVVLRPKPTANLTNRYLYYAVTHPRFIDFLDANATGSAYPAANLGVVERGEIPIPPLEVQEQIGDVLGVLDRKVKHNLEGVKKLVELRDLLQPEVIPEKGTADSRLQIDEE